MNINNLILEVSLSFPDPGNITITDTWKVVDYIACTTPLAPGEESQVLQLLLLITPLLDTSMDKVFEKEVISLAMEGRVTGKDGAVLDKGVPVVFEALCKRRARLYMEQLPHIVSIAEVVRPTLSKSLPS
jgi:hypothetical protein